MHSKKIILISAFLLWIFSSACTPTLPVSEDEHNIGDKLANITKLQSPDGNQTHNVVVFDEVVRKIHQFDINSMKVVRTLSVPDAGETHYVLYNSRANSVIDLSLKGVNVFDSAGRLESKPIQLPARPKSAAADFDQGFLVIYDENSSVGILQLDSDGSVLKSLLLGSLLSDEVSIVAGDIIPGADLILSLSNGKVAIVDLLATLTNKTWQYRLINTSFSNISWLAPVRGKSDQILVKYQSGVGLVRISDGATLSQIDVSSYDFLKLSKLVDAHVIVKKSNQEMTLIFTEGANTLKTRTLFAQNTSILSSQLDLQNDQWRVIESKDRIEYDIFSNSLNTYRSSRSLKRTNISGLLSLPVVSLPSRSSQIILGQDFFFALYPADLGFAEHHSLITGEIKTARGFNRK